MRMPENFYRNLHIHKIYVLYFLLILSTTFIFLFHLGHASLLDFDEAITAIRIREMASTSDYFTVHDNYSASFRKPPLYYWLSQPIVKVVGVNEFSVRIISAIAGILCVCITVAIAQIACGKNFGILSGFLLATDWLFVKYSRQALLDSSMILFGLCTIYFCMRYLSSHLSKWLILAFISAGIGTLTKGPPAFVLTFPTVCLAGVVLILKSKDAIRPLVLGLLFFFTIILPWHIHQYLNYGKLFLLEYFQLQMSSSMPVSIGGSFIGVYGNGILKIGPVLLVLAPVGLFLSIDQARKKNYVHLILMAYFFLWLSILIFYHTRRLVYLTPLLPLFSILSVYALQKLAPFFPMRRKIWLIIFFFLHLSFFAYQSKYDFNGESTIYKKKLAETAKSLFKGKYSLLLAYNNVHIPSLIYYSQLRTVNVSNMAELKSISSKFVSLPVILLQNDVELFQEEFSQAHFVKSEGPYSLWLLRNADF